MENKEYLLSIKDLVVQYVTDEFTVHAVNGLNFTIKEGETIGLVGETGAGKTTTAKTIMRLLPIPPAKVLGGQILFNGRDLFQLSEKEMTNIRGREISMIFQDPMTSLNPSNTVGDQIAEVFRLHRTKNKKEAKKLAGDMLEMVGIDRSRAKDYPHQFSGGMKQRVVIAMALACQPKLLLADEPTTALDVTIQAQVLELMRNLQNHYKMSMIMITHDLGIVANVCDHVAIMYAGGIIEYGDKNQIFDTPSHPYTQGLLACIPDIANDENKLIPIEGLMPDPTNLPQGCAFAPRCKHACEQCCINEIKNIEVEPGHYSKCIFAKDLFCGLKGGE